MKQPAHRGGGLAAPALFVLALCTSLSGCALQLNTRSLGVPVTMAAAAGQSVPGDTFNITTHSVYVFWGLATAKRPNLRETLAGQLGSAGGVASLAIHSRMRWSDLLLTAITLGVVSSTSVTMSGVVTRGAP